MKHIRKFESFRRNIKGDKLNEEFIFGAIKGALAKVMQAFSNTFKDFANDFKKEFKPDDPNSIKNIIMTNFNQAVDGAQKMLGDKVVDEAGVNTLLDSMTTNLTKLAQGLDKDVDTALGKDKSVGAKTIAKAILLGNKEAQWAGIVGLIDPAKGVSGIKTNYKYSKVAYEKALADAAAKGGANPLQARKAAASKFLDNMQKDIQAQLDKEFSEEEVKKIYDDSMKKAGQSSGGKSIILDWGDVDIELTSMSEDEARETYKGEPGFKVVKSGSKKIMADDYVKIDGTAKKGDKVKMTEIVRKGVPTKIDGQDFYETGALVKITEDGKEVQEISFSDNAKAEGQDDLVNKLKDIKTKNPENIQKIGDVAALYADPEANKDKIAEIEKTLNQGGGQ